MSKINMKQVFSSHVHSVGHDPVNNELHVEYQSGARFKYKGVDSDKARMIMNHESIGKALHTHVRGQHDHEEM